MIEYRNPWYYFMYMEDTKVVEMMVEAGACHEDVDWNILMGFADELCGEGIVKLGLENFRGQTCWINSNSNDTFIFFSAFQWYHLLFINYSIAQLN